MKQLFSAILIFLILAGCKETFDTPPQAQLVVKVSYTSETTSEVPVISAYGAGQDSIWIYQETTSEFNLPLSINESSSFVVLFDSIPDTLTIFHESTLNYESIESGFYYEYWIKNIRHTYNRIDSVVVLDSAVTQFWNENIELYINDLPADTNTD